MTLQRSGPGTAPPPGFPSPRTDRWWPTAAEQIPLWLNGFDVRLRSPLDWFADVMLTCTGDPDRFEDDARHWDDAARRVVDRRRPAAAADLVRVSGALRAARDALWRSRCEAIDATQAFLDEARWGAASIRAGTTQEAAVLLCGAVADAFARHRPSALRAVAELGASVADTERVLDAVLTAEPTDRQLHRIGRRAAATTRLTSQTITEAMARLAVPG